MSMLTALLAFAVTMMVLSTMVAAIVQVIHEVRRVRQRHFRKFVGDLFDEVIWPRVAPTLDGASALPASPAVPPTAGHATLRTAEYTDAGTPEKAREATGKRDFGDAVLAFLRDNWKPVVLGIAALGAIFFLIDNSAGLVVPLVALLAWLFIDRQRAERDYVAETQDAVPATDGTTPERGTQMLTASPAGAAGTPAQDASRREAIRRAFIREMTTVGGTIGNGHKRAEKISVTDFATRLAGTEAGRALTRQGRDRAKLLLVDIARRFDLLGRGSSTSFAELSRKWSIMVAFVLAFAVNVDAVTLLRAFMTDPELAAKVAEHGPQAAETLKEQLAELRNQEEAAQARYDAAGEAGEDEAKKDLDAIKAKVSDLQAALDLHLETLSGLGVPIGWAHFPYCQPDGMGTSDTRCETVQATRATPPAIPDSLCRELLDITHTRGVAPLAASCDWLDSRFATGTGTVLAWLVGALLGGALIGLGGPFWYDIYRRLSAITSIARGLGLSSSRKVEPADPEAGADRPKSPETAHAPKDVVDAFMEAADADALINGSGPALPRRLLDNDGTVRP